MDEITQYKRKKTIEKHLQQVDVILTELAEEVGQDRELTPEMVNDIYKLALDKWKFLYKYDIIK